LKNKTKKSRQTKEVDVYSRFSESNIEFVTIQDEREVIAAMRYSQEMEFFNQEREYYDQNH
jgi:hypothetical protein